MFVVKACLRDETRRFTFEGTKFPPYTEIQNKVSLEIKSSSIFDTSGVEKVVLIVYSLLITYQLVSSVCFQSFHLSYHLDFLTVYFITANHDPSVSCPISFNVTSFDSSVRSSTYRARPTYSGITLSCFQMTPSKLVSCSGSMCATR
jgi:hypothetical protein